MLSLDTTTRAEYDAAATAAAKSQAVLDALSGTVTVAVYNGSDAVMGTGTMQAPWAIRSGAVLTVGEVGAFSVTTNGTPDANWYLRFEGNSRWLRGTFGLTASGQDFTWSLPTWEAGQDGTLGTVTASSTSYVVDAYLGAAYQVANGAPTITFGWNVPEGYGITLPSAGGQYDLAQHLIRQPGVVPTYALPVPVAGVTVGASTGLLQLAAGATAGAYNVTVIADSNAGAADWTARSTEAGVVWAHRFDYLAELTNHLNPADNADLGNDVVVGVTPDAVTPHIVSAASDGSIQCLEIIQLGGELAAPLAEATLTTHGPYAGATVAANLATTTDNDAILTLPVAAADLGIVSSLSVFKIIGGANDGKYCRVTRINAATNPCELVVAFSSRAQPVAQTGLSLKVCNVQSLANPYQEVVIDEHVADVGAQTWPYPTGWVEGGAVPADAYTVVLHYDTTFNGQPSKYKDKVTVVKKVYDSNTQLSTLTVRRATMGMGDAGRPEADIVNLFYPCEFPAGTLIGRDVTGGWTRPLAALSAGANGLPTDDRAASGAVPKRQWYPTTKPATWNFRSGYYGHEDYHGQYTTTAPFTPNTYPANGAAPFNGNEFYLAWQMKYSPMYVHRVDSSKLFFLDQYQTPDDSQIVGSSYKIGRTRWAWFHNYGSFANSDFPDTTWNPPLGEWFATMIHIRAGHDNCMSYNNASTVVATATNNTTTQRMTLTCGPIPLSAGLTLPSGRYPVSAQNPDALDPQRSGYFDGWKVVFKTGAVLAGDQFKVLSHVVADGVTTFTLGKLRTLDAWPTVTPAATDGFRVDWDGIETARYKDTTIELYKRQASDSGWVLVDSFDWAITFNGGTTDASAGNPKGWNNFQPTGYANIDDNNPPGSRTIWTRYGEVILSHSPIAAPQL